MSDLEKMSLVELRVAGRKMGVKNVTTYKKRELLELLLEVEKNQSSNAAESAVDNAENASADVKIKKTENRKKEEKKYTNGYYYVICRGCYNNRVARIGVDCVPVD